ncbi:hypothetical protein COV24_00915 [candidate division WWE3 bacterium CG10_big_fil_rev_8_21_14_0_10_32_10]|uniref:PIN domain-containing protein n=1 Tax=candidate division WWE3 bacterium CG10_big_fil_rev_8_21_14_0_10_32_10 TaxID=1975090 RepID=A0A2H0RD90_UNCKA|nr:MAG: hypothetical protein COV24_00915 [candidate division WWE3 bacterium CG10_big_fil_rev_8_21_14_0_10_32_10]
MRYIIDTNIFIRVLETSNKTQHEECKRFLRYVKINKIEASTLDVVLAEIDWTLKSFYKVKKSKRVESLKYIINLPGLGFIHKSDINTTLTLYENHNVKFVDCLLASIPQVINKEWAVVSYDKDFDKLGIIRKNPGELVI